jgi:hypothetical protein
VFHLKCFTCFVCRKQLLTGEELYVVDDSKFVCKEDYAGGRGLNDSLYEDEEELEDEEAGRLEEEEPGRGPGEANNNCVSGHSPAHSKSPVGGADSSAERDGLNDSEGRAGDQCQAP